MRKYIGPIFEAWEQGKSKTYSSHGNTQLWTDGTTIYSYRTPIVRKRNGKVAINVSRFSNTTTNQQSGLRLLLSQNNYNSFEFETVRGASPDFALEYVLEGGK